MKPGAIAELSAEQCREVAAWIDANSAALPESVRAFLALHQSYLAADGDPRKPFDSAWRELRRALRITPSSERRPSGSPLSAIPGDPPAAAKSEREKLEEAVHRGRRLGDWHLGLNKQHDDRATRIEEKLAKMPTPVNHSTPPPNDDIPRLEDIELTPEDIAENAAAGEALATDLGRGTERGADPALKSVNETLMPSGAVLAIEKQESLSATLPADLADATVVKTLHEQRVRYDFSVSVTRIEVDVEKKVVVDAQGERHVVSASTAEYGPPRYSVTWSALANLAILVAQFALPFNRLATLLSTTGKRFTAGALSRMLHYVAERLVPVYLELASQLANPEILAGDDTSCRVIEVSKYFAKPEATDGSNQEDKPPWAAYRTPKAADESLGRCEELRRARKRRRDDGDRDAKPTPDETPSLGVLIGRKLAFESPRRNGDGAKESMNTTVISGRSVAEDPRSLIVFYRSHLGGCGNLFESILKTRDSKRAQVKLQGDLSSTNFVTCPDLLKRFSVKLVGCAAHARRPFANYEHEDPVRCGWMLHLFLGIAMHEQLLDECGRNRENVLAVRQNQSRQLWDQILDLAKVMARHWSKATKLGAGARYIIKHFNELTAYLADPHLEPTNNLRERMLRMEKLIEGSSMFRRSLEGRFVLDIVRTVLQTAVAAGVPVHEYLISVLRASPEDVTADPARFTPRAWASAKMKANAMAVAEPPSI